MIPPCKNATEYDKLFSATGVFMLILYLQTNSPNDKIEKQDINIGVTARETIPSCRQLHKSLIS